MNNPTTLSKFLSGTFFTGSGKIFSVVLGFVCFLITARWLTPEELGVFTLLQVTSVFVSNFSDFGINTSITKFLADCNDEIEHRTYIFNSFIFRSVFLLAASLLAIIAHKLLFSLFGSSIFVNILPFLPILILLEGYSRFYNSIFEGLFKFQWIGILDIITSISSFIFIVYLVIWREAGLNGRIFARIFALTLPLILMLIIFPIFKPAKINLKFVKSILTFGFPLYINQILSFVFLRADTYIIGALLGPVEIAIYEIARKIPESIEMLYDAFRKVYFPMISHMFSNNDHERGGNLLNTSTRLITFVGGLIVVFVFLTSNEIIKILFSNKYAESAPIFAVLMIALVLLMIDYTLGYTLVAAGESNKPPLINIARTGVNFIGYFTLIRPLGVLGAALAGIIGTVFVNPVNVFFLRRTKVPVKMSFYLKPFLIMSFVLLLNWIIGSDLILVKILLLSAYLILSFVFSVVTKQEFDLIMKIANSLKRRMSRPPSHNARV